MGEPRGALSGSLAVSITSYRVISPGIIFSPLLVLVILFRNTVPELGLYLMMVHAQGKHWGYMYLVLIASMCDIHLLGLGLWRKVTFINTVTPS